MHGLRQEGRRVVVAREAAGVEHEHHFEAVLHRVLDQPLEVGALVREAAGLEVDVLLSQIPVLLCPCSCILGQIVRIVDLGKHSVILDDPSR